MKKIEVDCDQQHSKHFKPQNDMVFIRRWSFLGALLQGNWQLNLDGLYLKVVFVQRWSL